MEAELRQIRERLDDLIEDELEFTPEFERSIQDAEPDMAAGKTARVMSEAEGAAPLASLDKAAVEIDAGKGIPVGCVRKDIRRWAAK